jgi:hypothetical protein
MPKFTNERKAKCARREIRKRQFVYPDSVAKKRMTQAMADEEIAVMCEIAEEYEEKAKGESLLGLMG